MLGAGLIAFLEELAQVAGPAVVDLIHTWATAKKASYAPVAPEVQKDTAALDAQLKAAEK